METIASAVADDIPALADLLALLFSQEADFRPDRAKQERGLRLILESPTIGTIFVAQYGGEVVGMVSLLYTVSTAEGGPLCWLQDLVVRPHRRGEGIGSRLLRYAIDFAKGRGFLCITLLTDRDNEGAIRLYERHGFERSGMMPMRMFIKNEENNAQRG